MAAGSLGTLPNVEMFCLSYELGSFTKAAEALGVTPQAASRAIARLERALGVTLFRRNTRTLSPTNEARLYYQSAKRALTLLSESERVLSRKRPSPSGITRISAPTSYGHHRLLPLLARFRERYPLVEVEAHIGNRNVDFVREGFDLAIRMGVVKDATLVSRKLGAFTLGLFASPSYVARHGEPRSVDELAQHQTVAFVMPSTGRSLPWELRQEPKRYEPNATYRCEDDVLALVTLARAGVGIVQTYHFLVERELGRGELVELLPAYAGCTRTFSLIYPERVVRSSATRALIEMIVNEAKKEP